MTSRKRMYTFVIVTSVLAGVFLTFHNFAHLCPLLAKSTPVFNVTKGEIQGRVGYSLRSGKAFWQFLGIPYAEAPVGELRFQPPVPLKKSWDGVKQTIRYPQGCFHYDSMGLQLIMGMEDCLFLNVFVSSPSKESISKPNRPVLVSISGGGYQCGSAKVYFPDFFMDQDDIILITFDYRLGPLGFLNLAEAGDYSEENMRLPRGNMGLKDQLLVLQWIQENIAKFGGDPKKVTLIGESAGGAMVHMHMLSNKSEGLFQKGISFSGTALNPWAFSRSPEYQMKTSSRYVKLAGCPLDDKNKLWECLATADFTEVVKQQRILEDPSGIDDMLVPSIELVNSDDTIFDKHPRKILEAGGGSTFPWILGVNSGEGAYPAARFSGRPDRIKNYLDNWVYQVAFIHGIFPEEVSQSQSEKIRDFYFGNANLSSIDQEVFLKRMSKFVSDSYFYAGVHQAAMQHVINGAPAHLLYFNYTSVLAPGIYTLFRAVTPKDWMPSMVKMGLVIAHDWFVDRIYGPENGSKRFGVSHADDLLQVFNLFGVMGYLSGPDKEFSNALVKAFVDFARSDEKSPLSFRGVEWPALTKSDATGYNASRLIKPLPTMLMDNSKIPKVILEPYADSLEFLTQVKQEEKGTFAARMLKCVNSYK